MHEAQARQQGMEVEDYVGNQLRIPVQTSRIKDEATSLVCQITATLVRDVLLCLIYPSVSPVSA